MGIASLLGSNPLKWKQTSPILLPHVRPPLSTTKPIKFSAATFNYKQSSAKFNVKLKCFLSSSAEEKSHLSCSSSSFSSLSSFSSSPPLGRVGGSLPVPTPPEEIFVIACWLAPFLLFCAGKTVFAAGKLSSEPAFLVLLAFSIVYWPYQWAKTSVVKLQVCLLGTGRTLQRNLSQITQAADTDSFRGLSWVLKETTIALIRHLDHCIAGYSVVTPKFGLRDAKAYLNQLSWEERLTFDEETLVNVNNMKTQSLANQRANGFHNQYIVVTILLAIRCKYTLPSINSSAELKEALLKLSSLEDLWGVEVLWTPQSETNTLLEEELLKRYPLFNYF